MSSGVSLRVRFAESAMSVRLRGNVACIVQGQISNKLGGKALPRAEAACSALRGGVADSIMDVLNFTGNVMSTSSVKEPRRLRAQCF